MLRNWKFLLYDPITRKSVYVVPTMLSFIIFEIVAQAYLVATFYSFKDKLSQLLFHDLKSDDQVFWKAMLDDNLFYFKNEIMKGSEIKNPNIV